MTYRGERQDALIQVRCYSREKRAAQELAKRSQESVSDLVRRLLAAEIARQQKRKAAGQG